MAIIGDFNGDGCVDSKDLEILQASFGYCKGDPEYNPACDLNGDGCVDGFDFTIFRAHYNEGCNGQLGAGPQIHPGK